ncbi:hypothetical protein K505DRAFT_338490 [Melanomma pulvis-pyrius CBS 109.77]|uniref:Uncharacterized protein n=1 Tax=Melanomma pulvis-pyrius CBS 109.77 TaxID=1314802 RepID=A0A6A6XA56_9PLEO|nr:hypothetical protein K505DRAFT_338490 [Melanomma pulvis-pyrius CBS 109.77]
MSNPSSNSPVASPLAIPDRTIQEAEFEMLKPAKRFYELEGERNTLLASEQAANSSNLEEVQESYQSLLQKQDANHASGWEAKLKSLKEAWESFQSALQKHSKITTARSIRADISKAVLDPIVKSKDQLIEQLKTNNIDLRTSNVGLQVMHNTLEARYALLEARYATLEAENAALKKGNHDEDYQNLVADNGALIRSHESLDRVSSAALRLAESNIQMETAEKKNCSTILKQKAAIRRLNNDVAELAEMRSSLGNHLFEVNELLNERNSELDELRATNEDLQARNKRPVGADNGEGSSNGKRSRTDGPRDDDDLELHDVYQPDDDDDTIGEPILNANDDTIGEPILNANDIEQTPAPAIPQAPSAPQTSAAPQPPVILQAVVDLDNLEVLHIDGTYSAFSTLPDEIKGALKQWVVNFPDWLRKIRLSKGKRCVAGKGPMQEHIFDGNKVVCKMCAANHEFCIKKYENRIVLTPLCAVDRVGVSDTELLFYKVADSFYTALSKTWKPKRYKTARD